VRHSPSLTGAALVVWCTLSACGATGPSPTAIVQESPPPPACRFQAGFAEVRDLVGDLIGDCVENERTEATTGDSQQRTTRGLLVWRKSDGLVAFTDGGRSWVRGPDGKVYVRANDQRFSWEALVPGQNPVPPIVTPGPAIMGRPDAAPQAGNPVRMSPAQIAAARATTAPVPAPTGTGGPVTTATVTASAGPPKPP
jgi:hypothetical protein